MRLSALYEKITPTQRKELAAAAGIAPGYLFQIATRWRGKRASATVISKLAAANKKLKLADLIAEFAATPEETRQQKAHRPPKRPDLPVRGAR
jgi:hypothetical protein